MSERRERTRFWGSVAALLAATGAAYALLLGPPPGQGEPVVILADEPPPAAEAATAPASPLRLAVLDVAGEVTLLRGGTAVPAGPADPLREGDTVVTGPGARLEVAGATYAATLEELGRLEVGAAAAGLCRLRLESGLLSARVSQGALEIAGAPGVSVRGEAGALSVARDGASMTAAVRQGRAVLRAAGASVALAAGQRALSGGGQPPSAPEAIPSSLVLEVDWPVAGRTGEEQHVVTGRTAPGAMVLVGEERAAVAPDGRFRHPITLREGEQRLTARARDVGGLEATAESPPVLLDTRRPAARFDTRGLWKKR